MNKWKNINDESPPCDSETIFVGVSTSGYCGCFNEHGFMSTNHGKRSVCLYATAEGCHEVMTDLEWWCKLEMPTDEIARLQKIISKEETQFPVLDGLLSFHLENGAEIKKQEDEWHLFAKGGEGLANGKTISKMLINLIFRDN